jgi:recombination protein RecA
MTVSVQGQINHYQRVRTGLYSLDYLLANRNELGYPLRTAMELYGPPGVGKSTLAMALAGIVCKATDQKKITIADLETALEEQHMAATLEHVGFDGILHVVEAIDKKQKGRTHEAILREAIDSLMLDTGAVIIDSVGAIIPNAEMENDLEAANMGRRAQLVAKAVRRILAKLRIAPEPRVVFMVNHMYQAIGYRGHITPGGDAKGYAVANRLVLKRKETLDDGSSHVQLKVEKLRYGGVVPNRKGYVFIIPNYGVSREMTAVFDCFESGKAERKTVVKIDGTSYGRLSALVEKARSGDHEIFKPFFAALEGGYDAVEVDEEDEDEAVS